LRCDLHEAKTICLLSDELLEDVARGRSCGGVRFDNTEKNIVRVIDRVEDFFVDGASFQGSGGENLAFASVI
jgi:hypothetical protein